jgi:hypothetical protein
MLKPDTRLRLLDIIVRERSSKDQMKFRRRYPFEQDKMFALDQFEDIANAMAYSVGLLELIEGLDNGVQSSRDNNAIIMRDIPLI